MVLRSTVGAAAGRATAAALVTGRLSPGQGGDAAVCMRSQHPDETPIRSSSGSSATSISRFSAGLTGPSSASCAAKRRSAYTRSGTAGRNSSNAVSTTHMPSVKGSTAMNQLPHGMP